MQKWLLLILLNLYVWVGYSQQNRLDSTFILLKAGKADTSKLIDLNKLSREYIGIGSYDSALSCASISLELSKELLIKAKDPKIKRSVKKSMANAHIDIGIVIDSRQDFNGALKHYTASLKLMEEIGNKKGVANAYCFLGILFDEKGNYPEALKNYFASLKLYEAIGNKNDVAAAYNNIGYVYYKQGNFEEALKNHFSSLSIEKAKNNEEGIADSYINIGIIYEEQGKYKEALKIYSDALKIMESLKNKQGISQLYNNIGVVYSNQATIQKDLSLRKDLFEKALTNQSKALQIRKEIDDKEGLTSSYLNIGYVYTKQGKFKEAREYLIKALQLAKEISFKENIKYAYNYTEKLDSLTDNYKGAYLNHKLYILYRDSLDNEETRKKTVQNQMSFDFEKKEAIATTEHKLELETQQMLAEEKSREQKMVILFVGIGLILVLIFAVFVFRSLRITRKQKHIIELQKNEVTHQKHLVEEKHKEITDSINYAERIQRSFLATKKLLNENLHNYFVFFQPKDVVSGDFYWASKLSNGNFALVTADSTGHGVPGAIMSILNISSLERAVEYDMCDPADILNHTRTTIIERLKKDGSPEGGKDGMDASLICFDFANSKFSYAAANNPVWIVREKELIELSPDKMPVGKHDKDNESFTSQEFQFKQNDVIYALTDGLPDQFGGPKGKKFMYKKLKELLISISHETMDTQKQKLQEAFTHWKSDLEQVDDVTLIGIRI